MQGSVPSACRSLGFLALPLALGAMVACGGSSSSSSSTPPAPTVTAPAITTQPADQTVTVGAAVTFTAAASGSPTWQWESSRDGSTWASISGATSATYAYTPVLGDNGLQFHAKATNSAGSATSGAATLTVQPAQGTFTSAALTASAATDAQVATGTSTSLTFHFPAGAVGQSATADITPMGTSPSHPLPASTPRLAAPRISDVFVLGFTLSLYPPSIRVLNVPVPLGGNVGTLASQGATLNLAWWDPVGAAWVDVATFVVGASGAITQNLLSTTLVGVLKPGDYVLYIPSNTTTVSNLGIALIGDDGSGSGQAAESMQVVHLFDANGAPLAQPSISYLSFSSFSAGDIDGQALTPDGSQGIMVDGGNSVLFFSGVQSGVPVASTTSVDVSAYGGDGDSIAILPDGNEAVVSGDSASQLVIVSGIKAGAPALAEVIAIPGYRDGLVISNDGKAMLARGGSGLTVFSIAPITPKAGSLGGTISHAFTQTADSASLASLQTVGSPAGEDGRDGMAFSPVDSSRAVVIGLAVGSSSATAQISLLTGLPASPAVKSVAITGASYPQSVAISPDGKMAVVGTNQGLALFTGVDTGNLAMVGSLFTPTFNVGSNAYTLGGVPTLGITLDGKYVVVCAQQYDASFTLGNGVLLTIPFSASGFGTIAGQLNDVAIPSNDQMVLH